ncbi:MAG: glycosyltransferase family 4 protein [Anaerolineae bacterium]|nr:glycosyltransferase family 4 protein [Anaerolineae bacterium]
MRVAMLGPFGLKPKGTMAARALPLAGALTGRGHTVTLILPPWSYPEDSGKGWEQNGVRIENVAINPRARIPVRMLSAARAFHPDAVYIFKPKAYSGLVQWLVWQLRDLSSFKPRILLDEDDWEGAGGWNDLAPADGSRPYTWSQKRFFAWQESWGLRHADAVTVASRALETIVLSHGVPRERVLYVPNGVNPLPPSKASRSEIRAELGIKSAPLILLYTRFFEFDLNRLVAMLTRVLAEARDAKLLLVGRGLFGEEERFLEMARAQGWRERVADAGWVESARLRGYFAAADVAIFPFDDTLVNRCKCSVKLVDLLANGAPVVAEAVGQVHEYIRDGETGILVPPTDVDTFARRVIELLGDQEKRARLGSCAASAMTREYQWEKLAGPLENWLYKSKAAARVDG